MAKPVARWRRSGTRDSVGLPRGPEASPPPGSSTPSDHQAPSLPRSFSSFRMQGIAPTSSDSGTFSSREDSLQRVPSGGAPSGFSSQSPSSLGAPGETPRYSLGSSDGSRGSFAPPASQGSTGSDPQSAISQLFGNRGLEAFNKLTLDDEYILHFYGVRQTFMKPAVQEHCERAPGGGSNGGFQHTLVWNVRGREFRASGIGRSKKDAKKEAVKVLLVQLGPVTPQIGVDACSLLTPPTDVLMCSHTSTTTDMRRQRGMLEWSLTFVSSTCGQLTHNFEWNFLLDGETTVVESTGNGSFPVEAEIAAMQDMYIKVQEASRNRKQQPQEHRSQITKPSQLSKHTAGEINMLHNTVTSQNQIKATETITEHVIVAVGSTKAGARAQAAMQMMQAAGFIEHVEDKDRQAALMVVNQVESKKVYRKRACIVAGVCSQQDPSVYVESACRLIAETRGAVWRIFLPVVWRAAMAEGNRSLVNSLIDQLKMQAAPRLPAAEQARGEGQNSPESQETVKASYDAPKVMPPDLWEQLLDECTVLTNCEFGQVLSSHVFAVFMASTGHMRLLVGSCCVQQRCFVGVVTSVKGDFSESMNVNVRVATAEVKKYPEVFTTNKFKLYYLTPAVTHDRMVQALRGLTMSKHPAGKSPPPYVFAPEIRYLLLHTSEPQAQQVSGRGPVPQLSDTDPEQYNPLHQLDELADGDSCKKQRVQPSLLQQVVSLRHSGGPPGTGKTHVACAIIDAWQRINPTKKILAVADSNVAADNLMEGLSNRGIRSVRVGSGSESDLKEESIQDLPRYRDLLRMRDKNSGEARSLRMLLVREAVRKYNVIIATCVGSGHEMFDDVTFERVIIDECAQSIEPSNLIPLGHGCRSVVLIGDHKQLPPTIVSREASDGGLGVSLLERFVGSGIAPIHLLNEQRRMHPSIAHFPNMQFYQGKIFSRDVDDCNRPTVAGFLWPSQHSRVCLIDISAGLANMEQSLGTSKYSLVEIDPILAILRSVLQCGTIRPSEIGILTPYDAQKARIRFALNDSFDKALCYQIDVDSVDGFQGKEKDLIIFSAVRSNPRGEIGFLKDARRLNVMLTRARRGLLVGGYGELETMDFLGWKPVRLQSTVIAAELLWRTISLRLTFVTLSSREQDGLHVSLMRAVMLKRRRSIVPISRLNDYLEVPTYNYNPIASGAPRVGVNVSGTGGVTATNTGGGAIKTGYMPQGFQADFGGGGVGPRGEGGREAAPEPMHGLCSLAN
ncbi:ATP-dependent helicase, putative [Eimeria acervulina]|uniref:ATP-dependent helicase, putative n=1 Tax=Eimeria acervulina TaxID=5801 RepID=U6G9Z5_EIMAC|nr:ATP-dependent helicase, putative [Eimeria acervulina]CDI76960.1 ATP-dependent helicase, putative [Eimeria acervulina]